VSRALDLTFGSGSRGGLGRAVAGHASGSYCPRVDRSRDEIRRVEPEDGELSEEWLRETSEPDLRGINVTRWADGVDWPWQIGVYVAEFVREEPLESELRRRLGEALRAVAGVEDVAEQDREVWIVRGEASGAALTAAAAGVVDEMADRLRAALFE